MSAPATTAFGRDFADAQDGKHPLAFKQRLEHAQSTSNALHSHLEGLHLLLKHDTFHLLPAIPITRAIAEVSASSSWILRPEIEADERAARAYASLFQWIQSGETFTPALAAEARDRTIAQLTAEGVRVVRRVDRHGMPTDEVAQIFVGAAHAKTRFQYTQRIADEIPLIASMYSGMSGVSHGELMYLSTAWETPDTLARLIGMVVFRSVESWSDTIHRWIGVTPGPFIHQDDIDKLIRSMPPDHLADPNQPTSTR